VNVFLAEWDGVAPAQAGWLGLVVLLAMAVAVFFLYRSMTKQLRKVPASFDRPPSPLPPEPTDDEPS
jgi:hypothetical protein